MSATKKYSVMVDRKRVATPKVKRDHQKRDLQKESMDEMQQSEFEIFVLI